MLGIDSPGLTAAPAIAKTVASMLNPDYLPHSEK
jgi:L-2-hydroxyglutarate oxidase LhgO